MDTEGGTVNEVGVLSAAVDVDLELLELPGGGSRCWQAERDGDERDADSDDDDFAARLTAPPSMVPVEEGG